MSMDREKLWQAYLDGELSIAETSEFEATLNAEERDRLQAEKSFESGLADALSEGAGFGQFLRIGGNGKNTEYQHGGSNNLGN